MDNVQGVEEGVRLVVKALVAELVEARRNEAYLLEQVRKAREAKPSPSLVHADPPEA